MASQIDPISCFLCYAADERGSMVHFVLERGQFRLPRSICMPCARAVTAAHSAALEELNGHELVIESDIRPFVPDRDSMRVASGDDDRAVDNLEPSAEGPEVNRSKPEVAARGPAILEPGSIVETVGHKN
jgi:hypothetical protein